MRSPSSGARASLLLTALALPLSALADPILVAQTAPRAEQPVPDQGPPPTAQPYTAQPEHPASPPNPNEPPPPPQRDAPVARPPEDRGPYREPPRYPPAYERLPGETRLDIGVSVGFNSPSGIYGGEIEYRALPQIGINLTGGQGAWGPRISPLVRFYPAGYTVFSPFLEAGLSINVGYSSSTIIDNNGERFWTFPPQVAIPVSVGSRIALGRYVYITGRAGWAFRTSAPTVRFNDGGDPDIATQGLAVLSQHYGFLISGAIGISPF